MIEPHQKKEVRTFPCACLITSEPALLGLYGGVKFVIYRSFRVRSVRNVSHVKITSDVNEGLTSITST